VEHRLRPLLPVPYPVSFLTAAAPDLGAVPRNQPKAVFERVFG
jgi:hypothetical protein